jgi:hypothetical protein
MAALFESATSGGVLFDTAATGAYGSDLDFDYLLSQVGVFGSPDSDDSFNLSNFLDDKSSFNNNGELSWHVEWFDSTNDIVNYDSTLSLDSDDQLKHTPSVTNGRSTGQNIKQQTEATATAPKDSSRKKVQKGRAGKIPKPETSADPPTPSSFINDPPASTNPQDLLSFELSPEELQFYSEAFISSTDEQPATISPTLLLAPLTPPPSSPLTQAPELTVTTPAQEKSKDKPTMDYSFLPVNPASEFYIPNNNLGPEQYGYPLTPQYMDPGAYVIDMAKSTSAPPVPEVQTPKKRRRAPETLNLTPPISNKRKRTDGDDVATPAPVQYKRPKLQQRFSSMEYIPSFGSTPSTLTTSTFESLETPLPEQSYGFHSDLSPYDTLMSCYTDGQIQYDQYALPQTPYHMQLHQEFNTPPVSPFESFGWYAPQRPYIAQKTQQTVWNTPRTMPHQYPISPAPTPQKKAKDPRRLSLAPQPQRPQHPYPLSPPHSAPPYPVTQQHLLPKLDPYDGGLPITPPKIGKKGRKGKNGGGGGMFINFTADDRETILSGVAPSGSSKAKKEKKGP